MNIGNILIVLVPLKMIRRQNCCTCGVRDAAVYSNITANQVERCTLGGMLMVVNLKVVLQLQMLGLAAFLSRPVYH